MSPRSWIFAGLLSSVVTLFGSVTAPSPAEAAECRYLISNTCRVWEGTVYCVGLAGIEAMEYNMNDKQLASIGCAKLTNKNRFIEVKPVDDPVGSFQKVKLLTPDKVIFLWVRSRELTA